MFAPPLQARDRSIGEALALLDDSHEDGEEQEPHHCKCPHIITHLECKGDTGLQMLRGTLATSCGTIPPQLRIREKRLPGCF